MKSALAYYNAGVIIVVVNSKVVRLAPALLHHKPTFVYYNYSTKIN
jgi:hypothetical protein